MKFFAAFLSLAFVAFVAAQNIAIGSPADGSSVSPGENITVQVERPVRFYPLFVHSLS